MSTLTLPTADLVWYELGVILDELGVEDAAGVLRADPFVTFEAIDIDSLGVIETAAHLDEQLGTDIADGDLGELRRPLDFVRLLTDAAGE